MKKVISVLLVAAMCFSLVACGKKEEKRKENRDRDEDENYETEVSNETTEESTTIVETEPSKTDKELPISVVCSSVSEGRFWVTYTGEDGNNYKGLADTDGNVLFSEQNNSYYTYCSDMKGGAACLSMQSSTVNDAENIVLVGVDGTEIKRFTSTEENRYKILGADKDIFIICQYTSGFSGTSCKINVVNGKGEITATQDFASGGNLFPRYMFKATDGVFWCKDTQERKIYLFQSGVPQVVSAEYKEGMNFYFVEGNLIASYLDDNKICTRITPIKTYASDADLAQALKDVLGAQDIHPDNQFVFAYCDNGYIFFIKGSSSISWKTLMIYDLKNSKWIKFPEYPDSVELLNAQIKDGYAFYSMLGGDGKNYYVVADTEGKQLYEPKQLDENFIPSYLDNGNLICNNGVILSSGEAVTFDKLPSGFKFNADYIFAQRDVYTYGIYRQYVGGICEGFYAPFNANGAQSLLALDGSKEIKTVKVNK